MLEKITDLLMLILYGLLIFSYLNLTIKEQTKETQEIVKVRTISHCFDASSQARQQYKRLHKVECI